MSLGGLTYAAITPARDEASSLLRLADALDAQTATPVRWIVVDNGSTDGTADVLRSLRRRHSWVRSLQVPAQAPLAPGAPVVRAFHAGLAALDVGVDVVVKLDADVTFDPAYFESLLSAFADDPTLGIASGSCWEEHNGSWREMHVTGDHVRGATRAYRRACLDDVLPLAERMGWDGIDELQANVRGWQTRTVRGLRFYHHRSVGERDGAWHRRWVAQGRGAYYLGYRPTYLLLRTMHRARREPAAVAMLWGYTAGLLGREPRFHDTRARNLLRESQRLRNLRARAREASGRPASVSEPSA
jgi:glycosyltransferase involved in cell wall biosynthesis